ncbi:MAG: 4'-phosphopantetheinyl transferase superfamily protein [Fretibacterium sp.]|nr:4'-phosphopantetheinyl transferase superfamily protein [Fretibacterium sp.]
MSVELHLLDLSGRLEDPVEPYLKYFTEERRAAILRYRFPSDRNRTVWTELLARWLIAQRTGLDLRDILIARDAQGKPYWAGGSGLHLSLSHSGFWAACTLGTEPNGVDVETARRIDLNIARHFFLPEEYEKLIALSSNATEEWRQAFLRYWTLKESCLKCLGTGLSGDLRKVDCAALLRGEGPVMGLSSLKGRNFDLPVGGVAGIVSTGTLPGCVKYNIVQEIIKE